MIETSDADSDLQQYKPKHFNLADSISHILYFMELTWLVQSDFLPLLTCGSGPLLLCCHIAKFKVRKGRLHPLAR